MLDALAPQESRIAGLITQGLSSKQIAAQLFLSSRTVEHHLYEASPKPGIGSRTDSASPVVLRKAPVTRDGMLGDMKDVTIWSEEFGAETDAPILLIMGSMSQGILWPDEFVGRLTAGGRRVIRYDHRDTGMSDTVDFAAEPYTWDDIKNDVYRVMDAHGLDSAHLVGHSAGGLLGQLIAVEAPERVRSLTVIASSPLGGGEGQVLMRALTEQPQPEGSLPEPAPEFVEFFRALMAAPPPQDRRALIDGMIAEQRVLHGTGLPFDEDTARRLQERIYDRARDLSAVANHRLAAAAGPDFEPVGVLHRVKAPTLVIEGSHEPVKPGHGAIIAEQIPGARLTIVAGMGHTLPLETHQELADAILTHTAG